MKSEVLRTAVIAIVAVILVKKLAPMIPGVGPMIASEL